MKENERKWKICRLVKMQWSLFPYLFHALFLFSNKNAQEEYLFLGDFISCIQGQSSIILYFLRIQPFLQWFHFQIFKIPSWHVWLSEYFEFNQFYQKEVIISQSQKYFCSIKWKLSSNLTMIVTCLKVISIYPPFSKVC